MTTNCVHREKTQVSQPVLEPDGNNNPSTETDYQYDALNNLVRVDQWGGPNGNAGDRVRTFTYDGLSRLLCASNPENSTAQCPIQATSAYTSGTLGYSYDANGNAITKTDARGVMMSYVYDALNRMTNKTSAGANGIPGFNYVYGYDSVSPPSPNGVGRLLFTTTSPGIAAGVAEEYFYDAMGRMIKKTTSLPSSPLVPEPISATYDLAGNPTSLTYPDGRVINQTWNGAGEVSQITDGSGYQYMTQQSTYYPNGASNTVWRGNGVASGVLLNSRLQPWAINATLMGANSPATFTGNGSLQLKEYCYGPAVASPAPTALPACPSFNVGNNGTIHEIIDGLVSGRTQTFGVNNLNQLTSFSQSDGSMQQSYTIDPWGNMTQAGTSTFNVSYGSNNHITSGGVSYDAAGNVTAFNNGVITNQYVYDAEGKLVNLVNGAAMYTYDANGDRSRKDTNGSFTEFVQFNGQTVAEKNGDGTWSDYIFANGQRLARVDNYENRIHMSGTNCSGCGSTNTFAGTQSLTALNGSVVRPGDLLTWRQFQDGVGVGGISLAFNNNSVGTTGVLRDTDGQLTDADTTTGKWHFRIADLTPYAGMTFSNLNLYNFQGGAPGNWDIFVAYVALVHTDGTFVPVYSGALEGLTQFTAGAAESNVSVVTEKAVGNPISTVFFYHGDQVGSTQLMTADTGWPVASYTYYPYGLGPLTATDQYLFTGKERDAESGLDYFGARYYGSNMGRMMSPDPIGGDMTNPQSLNKYAYALNNPLRYTDPTGLYVCATGQDCSAFEKSLDALRNSKNGDVARAAGAYGALGDKNGVTVGFADLSKQGEDGKVTSSLGTDANGNLQAQSNVTINTGATGAAFDAAIGHEGSHVADAQDVVKSIFVDPKTGDFTVGNNITRYQSEQRAYGVTNSILSSEGVNANEGCMGCDLGRSTMQGQVPGIVDRIMNTGNNYMSGGKHMGSKNQGGSVVNGVDQTPKAAVPQVPH